MADQVDLTELDVITRYSIAVRQRSADRDELIAALENDLTWLRGGKQPASAGASTSKRPATKTAASRATASKAGSSTAKAAKPRKSTARSRAAR